MLHNDTNITVRKHVINNGLKKADIIKIIMIISKKLTQRHLD